jgi:hypothetical protein
MKHLAMLLAVSLIVSIQIGCEEHSDVTGSASEPTYYYAELAVFDATAAIFSKLDYPLSGSKIPEPLVNWEQSLGEPFIDRDGNGIYDPAVDSFIISGDPATNQDLNGNGQYDGPDDPWSEGIPFDDIDGNGEFRDDPGDHISNYELGLPYADFNNNHIHDGDLKAVYGVMKWVKGTWLYGLPAYYLTSADEAVYRFVSDSGMVYDLPFFFDPTMFALIVEDDGLYYQLTPTPVQILPKGKIEADTTDVLKAADKESPDQYQRSISLNESLEIDGKVYGDLVKVQLEDTDDRYTFYFARKKAVVAYIYEHDTSASPGTWTSSTKRAEFYFQALPPSHPLLFPTTR